MQLNKEYAQFLMAASTLYASQDNTPCSKAESQFETRLFKLFDQAEESGVTLQDIVVITSTAVAVILTRQDCLPETKALTASNGNIVTLKRASRD